MGRTAKKNLTPKEKKTKKSKFASKDSNTKNEHIEVDNDIFNEDNSKEFENNAIQTEVNSENHDAQIEENPQVAEDNTMLPEGDSDSEATESETLSQDADATPIVRRKGRGPTKVKSPPLDPLNRIEVQFNAKGEPIGAGSVKLSSFLGPLVRERVPITLSNWRLLSDELKVVLWESVQSRFKLDEEWKKVLIFQQMGCIWRCSKCRLVRQIINAKTEEQRLQLRPNNIESMEWKKFIEFKTSSNFKAKSEKYKAISRRNQMPHTCSRRGLARLTEDLREHNVDPSSVSRLQVWIKSRTRKNGEPVSTTVADTIEKLKRMKSESESSSTTNIKEDTLSQVLGQDRPGRLRAMGRGMTLKKVTSSWTRAKQAAECESRISELEETIHMLLKDQSESWTETSTPQMSNYDQISDKCDLLDWGGTDEIVAEGRVVSSDPNELVHKIPLGPNAMKILIDSSRKSDAFLWRPTLSLMHIGDAEDEIVAWPASRVVLRMIEHKGESVSKTNSTYHKCKLYDWSGSEELVAEGRLFSSDPKQLVNDIPLGPFAMAVWVDDSKKQDAFLWRPTAGLTCVGEAIGTIVAWPESKLTIEKVNTAASHIPVVDAAASPVSKTSSGTDHICKLYDWSGSEELVAEGRLYSSDPKQLVNGVPLGPFSMVVWIDDPKKRDAFLWRPSAGMTCVGEAVGTKVAWPEAKVVVEKANTAPSLIPMVNVAKSPVSKTSSTYHKCKLYDWSGSEELVAVGRLYSSDPKQLVNDIPIGPFAMAVWIDDPTNQDAFLWRPTAGMTCVGEAIGTIVAWPESKVFVEKTVNSVPMNKRKFADLCGTSVVAEGRVPPMDPNALVHYPLERNAVDVLVELQKSQLHCNGDLHPS